MYKIWLEGILIIEIKTKGLSKGFFIIEIKTKGFSKGVFIIEIKTRGFSKGFLKPTKPPCFIEMHYLFCIFEDFPIQKIMKW